MSHWVEELPSWIQYCPSWREFLAEDRRCLSDPECALLHSIFSDCNWDTKTRSTRKILFIIKFCFVILVSVIGHNYKEITVQNLLCNKTWFLCRRWINFVQWNNIPSVLNKTQLMNKLGRTKWVLEAPTPTSCYFLPIWLLLSLLNKCFFLKTELCGS